MSDAMRQTLTPRAMDRLASLMLSRTDRAALRNASYDTIRDLFELNVPAHKYRALVRRLQASRGQLPGLPTT